MPIRRAPVTEMPLSAKIIHLTLTATPIGGYFDFTDGKMELKTRQVVSARH